MQLGVTGINGATSFGALSKVTTPKPKVAPLESQAVTDGFSSAGQAENLNLMKPGGAPAGVTLQVPVSTLASQGFQQTLAALSASGVPVQVVLVAEQALSGATPDKLASLEKRIDGLDQQIGYISGQQDRLERSQDSLSRSQDSLVRNDQRQDRSLEHMQSQLGMIADNNRPKPPVYTPPPAHKAPSYGSD